MAKRLDEMTVAELRAYAREHHITLSAGLNKQGIIDRITSCEGEQQQIELPAETAETPAAEQPQRPVRRASIIADDDDESRDYGVGGYARPQPASRPAADAARTPSQPAARSAEVLNTISSKAPAFHIDSGTKAWHNPRSFQPSGYHGPVQASSRTSEPRASARPDPQAARTATPQRFGPAETAQPAPAAAPRTEAAGTENVLPPETQPVAAPYQYARTTVQPAALRDYQSLGKPSVNELLAQDESEDAEGFCVLLRDGTAFLYTDVLLDDETIICLSAAQVRRFQLRTGDRVAGKTRKRRDGDKYRFMLYVTAINTVPVDDVRNRASFDSLHVIVPAKRLTSLPIRTADGERGASASAPVLYGQRVHAQAQGISTIQTVYQLGRKIQESKPDVRLLTLTVRNSPEEAALLRGAASWPVIAVDAAAPEDKQCQAVSMVAQRAARLAELRLDTVLLVSCAGAWQTLETALRGELLRLFACGRAFKEGGSLTVIFVGAEAPDTVLSAAASQVVTVIREGADEVAALDGTAVVRAPEIIV